MSEKPIFDLSLTDGYVLFGVNNEGKCHVVSVIFYDSDNYSWDLDEDDIAIQLENQIPKDLKDVLVLGVFRLYPQYDRFNHVEMEFEMYTIVKRNYRDLWRDELIKELESFCSSDRNFAIETVRNSSPNSLYDGLKHEIEKWEAFYEDEFKI